MAAKIATSRQWVKIFTSASPPVKPLYFKQRLYTTSCSSHGASSDARSMIKDKTEVQAKKLFGSTNNGQFLTLGRQPQPTSLVLQSNDYLCLSRHPQVVEASVEATLMQQAQAAFIGSAAYLHSDSDKIRLEKKMAEWINFKGGAVITQSGWAANVGLLEVVCDRSMPVYIDQFAHMSLHYGIRVAGSTPVLFRHNDMQGQVDRVFLLTETDCMPNHKRYFCNLTLFQTIRLMPKKSLLT